MSMMIKKLNIMTKYSIYNVNYSEMYYSVFIKFYLYYIYFNYTLIRYNANQYVFEW